MAHLQCGMILLALVTVAGGTGAEAPHEEDSTVLLQSSLGADEHHEVVPAVPPSSRNKIAAKTGPTSAPAAVAKKPERMPLGPNGLPVGKSSPAASVSAQSATTKDEDEKKKATAHVVQEKKEKAPLISDKAVYAAAAAAAAAAIVDAAASKVDKTITYGTHTDGLFTSSEPMRLMPGGRSRISTPQVGNQCGFQLEGVPQRPNYFLACKSQTLPDGIPDLRGNWKGQMVVSGTPFGDTHTERIEQCEDRVIITLQEAVYDFPHADDTFDNGLQDWSVNALPKCQRLVAAGRFDAEGCFTITPKGYGRRGFAERRCMMSDGHLLFQGERDVSVKMARVSDQFGNTADMNGLTGDGAKPQEALPAFVPTWPPGKEWESSSPDNRGRDGWGKANGKIKSWNADVMPHPTVDPFEKLDEIKHWNPALSPEWANKAKDSTKEPKNKSMIADIIKKMLR